MSDDASGNATHAPTWKVHTTQVVSGENAVRVATHIEDTKRSAPHGETYYSHHEAQRILANSRDKVSAFIEQLRQHAGPWHHPAYDQTRNIPAVSTEGLANSVRTEQEPAPHPSVPPVTETLAAVNNTDVMGNAEPEADAPKAKKKK